VTCDLNHQEDVVNPRLPHRLAAAAGLWLSSLGVAQEPARLNLDPQPALAAASADQRIADAIAERLGQAPNLRGYQVEVVVINGTVELDGTVADPGMRNEILRLAKGIKNVTQVRDRLTVQGPIQPVNGPGPYGGPGPLSPPVPLNGGFNGGPGYGAPPGLLPGGGSGAIDPQPVGGPGGAATLHPPMMPPYAWPTYAPYNNYSRVAYPNEYPYSAFPFIGPFYPFPKVPLGYRAIKLEWEDGHWWYGRTATKRDWWMVRYW
jgi:hypothetical protein